jgi:phosphatidylinositol glycan class K
VETPQSKRLATDEQSNVLIYMTGHGGDNFLKFQDQEEINARDLADALTQMHERKRYSQLKFRINITRYNEILLMIDTCQASTMHDHIVAPGVTAIASSIRGESSYSVNKCTLSHL